MPTVNSRLEICREVPLADIGTTAVIGHPVVMSLRWRSGSTLDLVAAYSLGRNLFDGAQHGFRSVVFQAGQDAHRISLSVRRVSSLKGAENEQDGIVFITGV